VEDFLVLSTSMQELRYFLDDYTDDHTLAQEPGYQSFDEAFEDAGNLYTYVNMARMHPLLKEYLGPESWDGAQKNKQYLTTFRHLGMHLAGMENAFQSQIRLRYDTSKVENLRLYATAAQDTTTSLDPEADVEDGMLIQRYNDGSPKVKGRYKDGKLQGDYREYYPDEDIRVQGQYQQGKKTGYWYYYRRNGNLKKKGRYVQDQKVGTWKYYNLRGNPKNKQDFGQPDTASIPGS
jgi:antitoxin component YwqK of YwqJK toxin-antitoxin module